MSENNKIISQFLIEKNISALRYLSLGSGQHQQQQQQQPQQHSDKLDAAVAAAQETRPTSATAVYEVARPILQGCHAVPTKLKILLDRALSSLKQEEVMMIVSGCGWHLEDYQRGYKLKVKYFYHLINISIITAMISVSYNSLYRI